MISGQSSNLEKDTSGIARYTPEVEQLAQKKAMVGLEDLRRRLPASFWVSFNFQGRTVRFGEVFFPAGPTSQGTQG